MSLHSHNVMKDYPYI